MTRGSIWFFLLGMAVLLMIAPAAGHVPVLPPPGQDPAGAVVVPDPSRSYAFYGTIFETGGTDYYQMTLGPGELLHFSLSTPDPAPFTPQVALMGPGITGQDPVPPSVQVPSGNGVLVLPGTRPATASYEPFTPMSLYDISEYHEPVAVPGTYYVAVFSTGTPGRYIFAPGYREAFSLAEWIAVPVQVMAVRSWEGQSVLLMYGPVLAVLLAGIAFLFFACPCTRGRRSAFSLAGSVAGLLYAGSGLSMLVQMGIALQASGPGAPYGVTMVLALVPLLLGGIVLWQAFRSPVTRATRVSMFVLGVLGLVCWAGLCIGPLVAMAASVLPAKQDE